MSPQNLFILRQGAAGGLDEIRYVREKLLSYTGAPGDELRRHKTRAIGKWPSMSDHIKWILQVGVVNHRYAVQDLGSKATVERGG